MDLGCFDVGAVRLLLHTESPKSQEPLEIGALSCYDRPQPHLDEYDQLLRNWPGRGGDAMSAPTVALQESTIVEYCKRLQLPAVRRQFSRLAQEAAKQNQSHISYLEALLESELEEREHNAITRRIQEARFPKVKTLEEFEFEKAPLIPANLIRSLAEGDYLKRSEPILLLGEAGTGKTHLATGLAVAACRQRKRVRFTTAAGLINELIEAKNQNELNRVTNRWTRFDLVVIDEMAYVTIPESAAELLFQVIAGVRSVRR